MQNDRLVHITKAGQPLGIIDEIGGTSFAPSAIDTAPDGTIWLADEDARRILHIDEAGGMLSSFGTPGAAPGELSGNIRGIEQAADGTLFVADTGNSRVQHFQADGTFLTEWGAYGTGVGQFRDPRDVAIGNDGTVYVSDRTNSRVQQFTSAGVWIRTITGGVAPDRFNHNSAIAIAPDGSLLVADNASNRRIQIYQPDGTFIRRWGGPPAGPGVFHLPVGMQQRSDGTFLIADSAPNQLIQHVTAAGDHLATIGVPGDFATITDLELTSDDSFWVSLSGSDRLQHHAPNGSQIGAFGSLGSLAGQFRDPEGLAIAPDGTIVVADTGNDRLQRVSSTGAHIATYGSLGSGPGQFEEPRDLAIDADGSLWVVDRANSRVQHLAADGTFLGQFGSVGDGDGEFMSPASIQLLADGRIAVSDVQRVQVFDRSGAHRSTHRTFGANGSPQTFIQPRLTGVTASRTVMYTSHVRQAFELRFVDEAPRAIPTATTTAGSVSFALDGEVGASPIARYGYSFDGGATWTEARSLSIEGLDDLQRVVRTVAVRNDIGTASASVVVEATTPDTSVPATPTVLGAVDGIVRSATDISHSATYVDALPSATGSVEFQWCADTACTTVVATDVVAGVAPNGTATTTKAATFGDGSWYVRARAVNASGVAGGWSAASGFQVDLTPPTVVVRRQVPGGRILLDRATRSIWFDISDVETGVARVTARVRGRVIPISANGRIAVSELPGTRGVIVVVVVDRAGNRSTQRLAYRVDRTRTLPVARGRVRHVFGPTTRLRVGRADGRATSVLATRLQFGRNVVRNRLREGGDTIQPVHAVVYRHVSLSRPGLNRGSRDALGYSATRYDMRRAFRYVSPLNPWYAYASKRHPLVAEAQRRLVLAGFEVEVTGRQDLRTVMAVKQFQRSRGIPVLGTIGPRTRAALDAVIAS